MKYRICLIFLFIVAMCGTTHANPDVLEKLRSSENHIICLDSVRDLFLMEDDAIPFLIQTLSDENENARQGAAYLLENYFGDPSALSALSVTFLHNTDNKIRNTAARAIANIDAEYARDFMAKHLDADVGTQKIVLDVLVNLKDRRVIPKLVERLKDTESREDAAYALADFKDKRAIPILIDILNDPEIQDWTLERVVMKLAHIDDEQTIDILLKFLDPNTDIAKGRIHSWEDWVIEALSRSGPAIVPLLLKMLEQSEPGYVRNEISGMFRALRNPKLVPVLEKAYLEIYLEIDDFSHRLELIKVLTAALTNMGTEGFEALLRLMKQKPDADVLQALTTYNSKAAIEAVADFALGKFKLSYENQDPESGIEVFTLHGLPPLRQVAIRGLSSFGDLGKAEVSKYIPQLLTDPEPKVKLLTLDLIKQMQLIEFASALKPLTQDIDENVRNAALIVSDILSGKTQLKLEVEPDQQQYDYGQPIKLTYRLKNVSNRPIKIGGRAWGPVVRHVHRPQILNTDGNSVGYDCIDITLANYEHLHVDIFTLEGIRIEILNPDGTSARSSYDDFDYINVELWGLDTGDYKTLNPGEELSDTITLSERTHWLHQIGRYTTHLHIIPYGNEIPYSTDIAWSNRISSTVHFTINPPTTKQVKTILKRIDAGRIYYESHKTYHQLWELDKTGLFPALKTRALVPLDKIGGPGSVFWARRLGPKFLELSNKELVPKCIEMLPHSAMKIILGNSGGRRAIKPLRSLAIEGSARAAAALQELGDTQTVKWCQEHAQRKLRHWNKEKRVEGAEMLSTLKQKFDIDQGYTQQWFPTHRSLKTRGFYSQNDSPTLASNWAEIVEKAGTMQGLKALLEHPIPAVRLGAAYELAYLGDKSGVHLIEEDLHANELEIRNQARDTLLKLHSE